MTMKTFGSASHFRRLATILSTAASGNLQENYIVGDDTTRQFFGVFWTGQTFTPASSHTLTLVKLLMNRVLLPGTVQVSIRATAAGVPTGGDIAVASTFDGDLLPADPATVWRNVNMIPVSVTASTKYAIIVRATGGDASNLIGWRLDGSSPTYAGGARVDSSNSGGAWAEAATDDMMFAEYGS